MAIQDTIKSKARSLINFINSSPSPWHTIDVTIKTLLSNGFEEIKEQDIWKLKKTGRYYITQDKSSIIAFAVGGNYESGNGFNIVAAHTDSPCLRLKPVSKKVKNNYQQVGVQCYGGGIWYTWFDKDLTLAGRVITLENNVLEQKLFNAERPILKVPTIAIHLNADYRDKFVINRETHLTPILALSNKKNPPKTDVNKADSENKDKIQEIVTKNFAENHNEELMKLIAEKLKLSSPNDIIDMELCLADFQPATLGGLNEEFIFAPRLDNLLGSHTAIEGFIDSLNTANSLNGDKNIRVLALYDNEEVGSQSKQGASSAFTISILKRIANHSSLKHVEEDDSYERALANSFLVSSDMAHAIHPNYNEKHEDNHRVEIDKGFVLKYNASQRYATTAATAAVIKTIARKNNIPLQEFVVKNDSASGTTIGPILSALLGVPTVDLGGPQLSMHSIRETCAAITVWHGITLIKAFYEEKSAMNVSNL